MNRKRVTKVLLGAAMVAGVGAALAHDLRVASAKRDVIDHSRPLVATFAHRVAIALQPSGYGARA